MCVRARLSAYTDQCVLPSPPPPHAPHPLFFLHCVFQEIFAVSLVESSVNTGGCIPFASLAPHQETCMRQPTHRLRADGYASPQVFLQFRPAFCRDRPQSVAR
jgi:hypothetical protein